MRNSLRCFAKIRGIILAVLAVSFSIAFSDSILALQLKSTGRFTRKGVVTAISAGQMTVRHYDGESTVYKIQDKDESAMSVGGAIGRNPAEIMVKGSLSREFAQSGMLVKMEAKMTRMGKSVKPIKQFYALQGDEELRVDAMESLEDNTELMFTIVGRVVRSTGSGLLLQVPKSRFARNGRMEVKVEPEGTMELEMDSLNRVVPGDTVQSMSGITYSNGDNVIKTIEITMSASRKKIETVDSWHDQLVQKNGHLSDECVKCRLVKSQHFQLHTDISELQAKVLLVKLETMHRLIWRYFGTQPKEAIECYIVEDFENWVGDTSINSTARAAIEKGSGLTISGGAGLLSVRNGVNGNNRRNGFTNRSRSRGGGSYPRATVYSCSDHSIVQHEAVHAFCMMAFGSTGPTWYSEGMAEMGNYWRDKDVSVNIDPVVIDYLTSAPRKSMVEIVNEEQITGDSWQAYAWRWALCHMLVNNSNYGSRFKKLGINLMKRQSEDSFYDAFGEDENELAFEYDQFLENVSNGYRVGLCKWDWKTKPTALKSKATSKNAVMARKGWQATKIKLVEGQAYDFAAKGTWKLSADGEPVSADGADGTNGQGQLVGAIFNAYELSEPFALGEKGRFVAQSDGQLFLRCNDNWNELADNSDQMTVYLRLSKKK